MISKPQLPPALKKRAHKYVDEKMCVERAYIAHCIALAFASAAHDEFNAGKIKVSRFMARGYQYIQEYFDSDPDTWPDIAQRDCERLGLEFDNYWIKARDREGNEVKLNITPEQQKYLEESRSILLSDAESKKIHENWKVFKG